MTAEKREQLLESIGVELDKRTRAKVAETGKPYEQCFKLVASENPDLDRRRARLQRGEEIY
jgi:hypothetical protein